MYFVGIFNYIFIFHIRIALFTSIPTTITTSPTTTTTITSNTTVGLIPKKTTLCFTVILVHMYM